MKKLFFILLILLLSSPAWAETYYMRADGSGTKAQSAASSGGGCGAAGTAMSVVTHNGETFASPPHTIIMCSEGGDYTAQFVPPSSGSAGSVITYQNNGTMANTTDCIAVYVNAKNYLTFSGGTYSTSIQTDDYCSAFYLNGAANITFSGVEIENSGNGVWAVGASHYLTVIGSNIHDNTFAALATKSSSGIMVGGSSTNFTISNNQIVDNGKTATVGGVNEGAGIRVQASGSGPGTITGNTITGNGTAEQGSQIEGVTTDNVTVERNYLSGGVCAEVKNSANSWIFRYNTCIGTASDIFQYGYETSESTGAKFYNNTIVGTRATGASPDYCVLLAISSPSAGEFWNNLLIHQGTMASSKVVGFQFTRMNDYATDMATFDNKNDYNLVYNADKWVQGVDSDTGPTYNNYTLTEYKAAFANQNQNSLDSNPLLNSNYYLSEGSPAIDNGKENIFTWDQLQAMGLFIFNGVPDIGANEYYTGFVYDSEGTQSFIYSSGGAHTFVRD